MRMETTTRTLPELCDLRGAADPAPLLLTAFDRLAAGESLVALVASAAARTALGALQADRKGLFEWSVLEAGDPLRVEVLRRNASPGELRGVTEALAWDHDRLDAMESAAFAARAAGDLRRAERLLAPFVVGLSRHIRFEEEVLFPVFEQRLGFPPEAGPSGVMRYEHRQIEVLLARMAEEIGRPGAAAEETRARLHAVLGEHNMKEERIVYPHTDGALGPEAADALVARIQST